MAAIGLTLRLAQDGGTLQGWVKSDRSGFFPTNEAPAVVTFTERSFSATALGIRCRRWTAPCSRRSNVPTCGSRLERADEPVGQCRRSDGCRQPGGAGAGHPYLDTTNTGVFLMQRPPVKPSTNEVQLVTVP